MAHQIFQGVAVKAAAPYLFFEHFVQFLYNFFLSPVISISIHYLEVTSKGCVILSAGRSVALDLENFFKPGTKLILKHQGNVCLILPNEREEDAQHSALSSSEERTSIGEEANGSTAEIVQHEATLCTPCWKVSAKLYQKI